MPGAGRCRHIPEAFRRQAPELVPRVVRPLGRRASRGPHVHLRRDRGGGRSQQQLAPARGDAHGDEPALRRGDEGAHDVRRPVLDGPARLGQVPHRRPAHGLAVRRRLDADHDPDGQGRARRPRLDRRVRPVRPLGWRSSGRGREGLAVADERRRQVHRPLPAVARDLVVRLGLWRQRAPRQEVPGASDRFGHGPRRGLDGRAHADSQADVARGQGEVRDGRVPVRVRQDQPRDADSHARGLGGRDGRRRHRLDEVRRRWASVRDQPGGRVLRRRARHGLQDQPERDGRDREEHDLHQLRAHR